MRSSSPCAGSAEPEKSEITSNVVPDENHVLVSLASIGRALGLIQKR
jgi:hypothetical protein